MSGNIQTRTLQLVARDIGEPLLTKLFEPTNPDRVRRFSISTDDVDRYSDVLIQAGIDLTHYRSNPVVLLNHNPADLPIGRAVAIEVQEKETLMDVEFLPAGMDESVDKVVERLEAGFMWAGSVGFLPKSTVRRSQEPNNELFEKYPLAERVFTVWELLEFSIVTIPANPMALAKSLNARYLGPEDVNQFTKSGKQTDTATDPDFDEEAVLKALEKYKDSIL